MAGMDDNLIRTFWRSTSVRVGEITELWLRVEEGDDASARELKRILHTLKGEAHMLGLAPWGRLLQAMEDVVRRGFAATAEGAGDVILTALDLFTVMESGASDEAPAELAELTRQLEEIGAREGDGSADEPDRSAPPPHRSNTPPAQDDGSGGAVAAPVVDPLALRSMVHEARRLQQEHSLVQPELREVRRMLRALLAEIDPRLEVESLEERIVKTLGYGAEIERRLATLDSQWSRNDFAMDRAIESLEEFVRGAAMVSVGALRSQIHRTVRTTAASLGRSVDARVVGDAYVDATVEQTLGPALLHLVRNAVDHGIEDTEARRAVGKPERGTIDVVIHQSDSSVRLTVTDDGAGIDLDALRRRLIDGGASHVPEGEGELLQRIFDHGVSTREEVTDISGRGVGLDVVSRQVSAVGGNVRVHSTRGEGTTFELTLPTMLRADVVVPVHVGNERLAFPARTVLGVDRIGDLVESEECLLFPRGGEGQRELLPLYDLAVLFGGKGAPRRGDPCVVVKHRTGTFAARVDSYDNPRALSFERSEELAFESTVVRGVAPAPDGGVYFLCDADSLYGELRGVRPTSEPSGERRRKLHALVVEDAPVARELLLGLLRSFGLRVTDAPDGKEGLRKARQDPPDVILTDVEMPFLGGLEMVQELKRDARLAEIPVVVLTTRSDDGTRRRASALGVEAFLSKQRFVESELRQVIDRCLTK